jgi:hypothetical protein
MRGDFKPPDFGKILVSGMTQSWKTSSEVTDARRECFPLISGAVNPFVPFSTRNPLISPPSLAHTTATSAIVPFVIHIFDPFRRYSPFVLSARVIIPAGFEP